MRIHYNNHNTRRHHYINISHMLPQVVLPALAEVIMREVMHVLCEGITTCDYPSLNQAVQNCIANVLNGS